MSPGLQLHSADLRLASPPESVGFKQPLPPAPISLHGRTSGRVMPVNSLEKGLYQWLCVQEEAALLGQRWQSGSLTVPGSPLPCLGHGSVCSHLVLHRPGWALELQLARL